MNVSQGKAFYHTDTLNKRKWQCLDSNVKDDSVLVQWTGDLLIKMDGCKHIYEFGYHQFQTHCVMCKHGNTSATIATKQRHQKTLHQIMVLRPKMSEFTSDK